MVVRPKGGALTGIILANPNLLKESKEVRKRILAKAWIEVMMGFHNEKGPENHVSGKLSLPGDDSLDEIVNMELAMHELLVPDKALDEMAQEFGLSSLRAVKDLIISDPQKAIATIDHIAYAVSGKRSANRELVRERIREILFIEV